MSSSLKGDVFMSTKDNFMQAVQELFGVEVAEEKNKNEMKVETEEKAELEEKAETAEPEEVIGKPLYNMPFSPLPPENNSEVSVLAKGLTIIGQVSATGDVDFHGVLKGDLNVTGDVRVYGEVSGNVSGKNVVLNAAQVKGNILAEQHIALDGSSVVIGDLNAGSLGLAGSVKGNIKVSSTAEFEEAAVLLGDVECTGISVKEGAEICGRIVMPGNRSIKAFEEDFADKVAGNI